MNESRKVLLGVLCLFLSVGLFAQVQTTAQAQQDVEELNNQIRRDKFDLILPQVMRENNVDM